MGVSSTITKFISLPKKQLLISRNARNLHLKLFMKSFKSLCCRDKIFYLKLIQKYTNEAAIVHGFSCFGWKLDSGVKNVSKNKNVLSFVHL